MKAWLVTWEWAGDHAKVDDPIVAIFNPRWSTSRIRELVELLYANTCYSLSERLGYANNRSFNPYPAEFESFSGVSFEGRIHCGHNPWLYARKVKNLRVADRNSDHEQLLWSEEDTSLIQSRIDRWKERTNRSA